MFTLKNISTAGRILYPSLLWKVNTREKEIFLTFDDGPIPEVTPWVLALLKEYKAKATFFCIGDNIRKHPEVYRQLIAEGHRTGNHTFHHLNGWKTPLNKYLSNVLLAEGELLKFQRKNVEGNLKSRADGNVALPDDPSATWGVMPSIPRGLAPFSKCAKLFRPPYGRISPRQIKALQQKNYKIVMWDVLSQDYNQNLSAEKCYNTVIDQAKAGSVVVFHDSLKARANLQIVLPKVLKHYKERGFVFRAL